MHLFGSELLFIHRKAEKDKEWKVTGKTHNGFQLMPSVFGIGGVKVSDTGEGSSPGKDDAVFHRAAVKARWVTGWICTWLNRGQD